MQSNILSILCPIDTDKSEPLIDKVISAVKGGTPASAAAMKSQLSNTGLLDWNHYVEWARTLSDMPALIHSDVNKHFFFNRHLTLTCQCELLYFVGVFQISFYILLFVCNLINLASLYTCIFYACCFLFHF